MPRQTTSTTKEITSLKEHFKNLQKVIETQQYRIDMLESEKEASVQRSGGRSFNLLNALKFPPIPVFDGKFDDYTYTKIKGLISNQFRVARSSNNINKDKIVQRADCHLQDREYTWITRIENKGERPYKIEGLKDAMMKEFVLSNEKAKAQLKILSFKMGSNLDKHIENYIDLIETYDTPTRGAYSFVFMSVRQQFKGKISEEFPESDPEDRREVLKCARKYVLAEKWATARQKNNLGKDHQSLDCDKAQSGQNKTNESKKSDRTLYDSLDGWSPTKEIKGKTYRDKERRYKYAENSCSTTSKIKFCTKEPLKAQKN